MVLRTDPSPSAELRLRALLGVDVPSTARRIGVEHEYAVYEGDRQVDFRAYVHNLGFAGRVLHPTNGDAILTPSGLAVMADGWVAETASPPEALRPGAASTAADWAERGRQLIERHLAPDMRLHPGSTHLSVETHSMSADQLCLWFAQTFAPALMLLLDRVDSPGILVRPRPQRFEVGGEFIAGERLGAALTFLAGAVIALESARRLPPAVEVVVEPARRRYGWYVDRSAFGPDLYEQGRGARLRLRGGGVTTAQAQLDTCWEIAQDSLGGLASATEVAAVERLVRGESPLPSEDPDWDRPAQGATGSASAFGHLVIERDALRVSPASATWDYVAFAVDAGDASGIVNVPYPNLAAFTERLDDGTLDEVLRDAAIEAVTRPILATYAQTREVGVFSGVSATDALLPRDRVGIGPGTVSTVRPGKVETPPPPLVDPPPPVTPAPSEPPPMLAVGGGFPWIWIAIPLVSLILTVGGGSFLVLGGGDAEPTPTPTPTSGLATPSPTETAPATATATDGTSIAVAPPVVGPIMAELVVPVTTYQVEAMSPAGLPLTYRWFLEAAPGQDCGVRSPATSAPTDSPVATWSHENAPSDDDCDHDAPDHPFNVRVEVSDGVNPAVIRTYEGSATGVGPTE